MGNYPRFLVLENDKVYYFTLYNDLFDFIRNSKNELLVFEYSIKKSAWHYIFSVFNDFYESEE